MLRKNLTSFEKEVIQLLLLWVRWWSHCFTMKRLTPFLIRYKKSWRPTHKVLFLQNNYLIQAQRCYHVKTASISPDIISLCHAVTIGRHYIPQTSDDEILESEELNIMTTFVMFWQYKVLKEPARLTFRSCYWKFVLGAWSKSKI